MRRRPLLSTIAGTGLAVTAGCLDVVPASGDVAELTREQTDVEYHEPPVVTVDDDTVTVRGTIAYGSPDCDSIELAHVDYLEGNERLDVLVAPGEESGGIGGCNADLSTGGYRVEVPIDGELRTVTATEHHHGDRALSTTWTVYD